MSDLHTEDQVGEIDKRVFEQYGWRLLSVLQIVIINGDFHPRKPNGSLREGYYYFKQSRQESCIKKWLPYDINTSTIRHVAQNHANSKSHNYMTLDLSNKVYTSRNGDVRLPVNVHLPEDLPMETKLTLAPHLENMTLQEFKEIRDSGETPTPFKK